MVENPEPRRTPAEALPYPGGQRLERAGAGITAWSAPDLGPGTWLLGCLSSPERRLGTELIRDATEMLHGAGALRILGPMDGSTWAAYRTALPDGDSGAPVFAGEPSASDLHVWLEAGFRPAELYQSRQVTLPAQRPGSEALAARLSRGGLRVREAAPDAALLRSLFELSTRAFARNRFYRPVSFELFCALQAGGRPGDVLLLTAEGPGGGLLGFGLAYADDHCPGRMVLKTLAAAPEASGAGLGAHLADELHARSSHRGYRTMVHALMHEDNASLRLSRRYDSTLLRRYALLEWSPG